MPSSTTLPTTIASKQRQPQVKRSLVLLTFAVCVSLLIYSQLSSPAAEDDVSDDDPMRYSDAGAHFRQKLSPEQLEAYYQRREASLLATGKLPKEDSRPVVMGKNVSSKYFHACAISTDNSVLHHSLRRGPDDREIVGRKHAKQPRDFDDVFSTIDRRRYYFDADRTAVQTVDFLGAGLDADLDDAIKVAKAVTEHDVGTPVSGVNVPIAYMRTTRQDGWQAIINFGAVASNTSSKVKAGSNVRRIVTVTRGYGEACETSFIRPREMVRMNVLIPYSSRPHRIYAFLKMFALYFEASSSSASDLIRMIISTTKEEEANVLKTVMKFDQLLTSEKKVNEARVRIVTSDGDEFGNFSRAVAVREAAKLVSDDEVIFIADTDLLLGGNFPQNCRVNIVRGSQVWFPVMFSLYPYGKGLSSRDGMWRRSSYGMACMYAGDFKAVGGFGPDEESRFTGWGSEDVFLYNRFRDNEKYAVLRSLEPGLQHQWHGKECERNEHYVNCMRTVYMTIGSQDAIAKLMVDANVDISNLTKNAVPV